MKKIMTTQSKILIAIAATTVVVSISTALGLVYGIEQKTVSTLDSAKFLEEVVKSEVEFGKELVKPTSREGYKEPVLSKTTYTTTTPTGASGIFAIYKYEPDGVNSNLKAINLTQQIVVINTKYEEEFENIYVEYSSNLELPATIQGYKTPVLETTNYTKTLAVNEKNIFAKYLYDVDGVSTTLKSKRLTRNITIITKNVAVPDPSSLLNEQDGYFGTEPESYLIAPEKLPFYSTWSYPLYFDLNNNALNSAVIKQLAVGQKYLAVYNSNIIANYNGMNISYKTTVTIKTGKTTAEELTTINENFAFGKTLDSISEKPAMFVGYSNWSMPTYTAKVNGIVTPITDLSSLTFNDNFSALYTATLLDSFDGFTQIQYKINYTFIKGIAQNNPSQTFDENYVYGTNTLPENHKPTISVIGYKNWESAIYKKENGEVFSSLQELNTISAGQKFSATYLAKKDESYNALLDATIVVNYTVVTAIASANPEISANQIFLKNVDQFPNEKTGTLPGYLSWTKKAVSISDESIIYENLAALNALAPNSQFKVIYTAKVDHNYATTRDLNVVVTYTVKNKVLNDPTNLTLTNTYDIGSSFVIPATPTKADGYQVWTGPVYTTEDGVKTYASTSDLTFLLANEKFKVTYTAEPDPEYDTKAPAKIVITYTVVKLKASTGPAIKNFNENFIYKTSMLPNLNAPQMQYEGFYNWSAPKYTSLDEITNHYQTGEQLSQLSVGTKFKATYKAIRNQEKYDATEDLVVSVIYSVIKDPNLVYPSINLSYNDDFYYDSPALTSQYIPKTRLEGYLDWTEQLIKTNGSLYNNFAELSATIPFGTFKAVYTAQPDPNFDTTTPAKITINFTIVKALAPSDPSMVYFENFYYKDTVMPTLHKPTTQLKGYEMWSYDNDLYRNVLATNVTYTTGLELSALPIGTRFSATYTATKKTTYAIDKDATIRVIYTIIKAQATPFVSQTYSDGAYTYKSSTITEVHKPSTTPEVGYEAWSVAAFTSLDKTITYPSIDALKKLNAGEQFIATYTALPKLEYDITIPATIVVTYTINQAPSASTEISKNYTAIFKKSSLTIPFQNEPTKTPLEYLPWTSKITSLSGTTTYTTLANLQALAIDEQFKITYTALPDSNYTNTLPLTITVTYTVKA